MWDFFIFPAFANLQGVDWAYWPTGQIGLLIQPFTNQVKSFFFLLIPISFKTWGLVSGQFNIFFYLPSVVSCLVDGFDFICYGFNICAAETSATLPEQRSRMWLVSLKVLEKCIWYIGWIFQLKDRQMAIVVWKAFVLNENCSQGGMWIFQECRFL